MRELIAGFVGSVARPFFSAVRAVALNRRGTRPPGDLVE